MKLRCHHCYHIWDYTGKKTEECICSKCHYKVNIKKQMVKEMQENMIDENKLEEQQKTCCLDYKEKGFKFCPDCGKTIPTENKLQEDLKDRLERITRSILAFKEELDIYKKRLVSSEKMIQKQYVLVNELVSFIKKERELTSEKIKDGNEE